MGLTVREVKKQVNAEVYLKQDKGDVNIQITTPDGNDVTVGYFDSSGQFYTILLDSDDVLSLKDFVVLQDDQLLVI